MAMRDKDDRYRILPFPVGRRGGFNPNIPGGGVGTIGPVGQRGGFNPGMPVPGMGGGMGGDMKPPNRRQPPPPMGQQGGQSLDRDALLKMLFRGNAGSPLKPR